VLTAPSVRLLECLAEAQLGVESVCRACDRTTTGCGGGGGTFQKAECSEAMGWTWGREGEAWALLSWRAVLWCVLGEDLVWGTLVDRGIWWMEGLALMKLLSE